MGNNRKFRVGLTPSMSSAGEQHVPQRYVTAIESVGCEGVMLRYEMTEEEMEALVPTLDGVLFTGGVDVEPARYGAEKEPECGETNPSRDAMELLLLPIALKYKKPILGICRGSQILNVGLGGTLVQDVPKRFGKVHQMPDDAPSPFDHDIRIVPGTMLHELMGGDIKVDSYHHQCVNRLADGLIPTAYAPEGFIEAYEMPCGEQFLMAVQWHPECTLNDDMYSIRIFECFRDAMAAQK